jgi:hypothetical protein
MLLLLAPAAGVQALARAEKASVKVTRQLSRKQQVASLKTLY